MAKHRHNFVETYDGMVAFGFSREVDESSLIVYLQKFSEDEFVKRLVPRLSDDEIQNIFNLIGSIMRKHISDEEYHTYFLKDDTHKH